MKAQFEIGQTVKAVSFTDCFGKFHPEVPDLTVAEVNFMDCSQYRMASYYRIKAVRDDSPYYVEGAERFFAD